MKTSEKNLKNENYKDVLVEFKMDAKQSKAGSPKSVALKMAKAMEIQMDESYDPVSIPLTSIQKEVMVQSGKEEFHFVFRGKIKKGNELKKNLEGFIQTWSDASIKPAGGCPTVDEEIEFDWV